MTEQAGEEKDAVEPANQAIACQRDAALLPAGFAFPGFLDHCQDPRLDVLVRLWVAEELLVAQDLRLVGGRKTVVRGVVKGVTQPRLLHDGTSRVTNFATRKKMNCAAEMT